MGSGAGSLQLTHPGATANEGAMVSGKRPRVAAPAGAVRKLPGFGGCGGWPSRALFLLEAERGQFAIDVLNNQNAVGDHGLAPQRLAAGALTRGQFAVIEL